MVARSETVATSCSRQRCFATEAIASRLGRSELSLPLLVGIERIAFAPFSLSPESGFAGSRFKISLGVAPNLNDVRYCRPARASKEQVAD